MFRLLKNWVNALRFQAENNSKTQKKPIPPERWALNASVETHQKQPFAIEVYHQLETRFTPEALTRFLPPVTTWAGLESLQTLEWLSVFMQHEAFPALAEKPLRWLDVGSKNFAYAPALALMLNHLTNLNQPWHLKGIELDAGRLDHQGNTRTQYAEGLINLLPNTTYQQGDILKETQQYQGISLFLPFVFEEPLLKWGLPSKHFNPLEILVQCISLLTDGGVLMIINLTPEEAAQQEVLFHQLPDPIKQQITWVKLPNPLPNSFIHWQYERIPWLCLKHPLPQPSA
ncbi:MAG: hypothetical protein NTW61_03390 [Candidatus Melainabacteria bacterium]|nr:hypothetical protein [Candidatus Melainabacteria bacterium]